VSASIRPYRQDDVPAVVELLREVRPVDLWSVESFRHWLRRLPERAQHAAWVAERDSEVVGWASALRWAYVENADGGGVHVSVPHEQRQQGLGSALLALTLEHSETLGLRRVSAYSVDEDGHRFLERRGFSHTHTERYSRLDPQEVDLAELEELCARLAADGFSVVPFTECRPEGVHAVDAEASADIPEEVPITYMPFEEWVPQHWEHPHLTKEGSFAVLHDGRPVSIAMLRVDPAGGRAGNDITGTLRAYRGRGLARLAKLAQLEWLAAQGFTSVVTGNDEANAPMLAVNTRLGYRPFAEARTYVRALAP
jgi:GNAT superfamily N-acetyltransferase